MAAGGAVMLGLIGKLPAHGDFVRRGDLPAGFCAAWDGWLQAGMAAARATLGPARWEQVWDAAPAWRFALPAGACGPDPAAGVLLPSHDTVGRRWPLTLAAVGGAAEAGWPAAWFAALEGVARTVLAGGGDADALAAAMPRPMESAGTAPVGGAPAGDPLAGFWAAIDADAAASDTAGADAAGADAAGQDPGPHQDPSPPALDAAMMAVGGAADRANPGWWTAASADGAPGLVWALPALPPPEDFVLLLETEP